MNIKAIYPGTFDPLTNGHIDIVLRAAKLFSKVIVAVVETSNKNTRFTCAERVEMATEVFKDYPSVEVISFKGLLVDFAKAQGADVLIRGVRGFSDFDYEFQMAGMNRKLSPNLETVFLTPSEANMYISSTLVREVAALKGDVSAFVPPQSK